MVARDNARQAWNRQQAQLLRELELHADKFEKYVEHFLGAEDAISDTRLSDDVVADPAWRGKLAGDVDDVTLIFDWPQEDSNENSDRLVLRAIGECRRCAQAVVVSPPVSSWETLGEALARGMPDAHDCPTVG